jgi:hypothetical protein
MKHLVIFFSLLILAVFVSANLSECYNMESFQQKRCLLDRVEKIDDCRLLRDESTIYYEQCVERFINSMTDVNDCEKVPVTMQGKCFSYVTFNTNPDDISSCYSLNYAYQKDCVRIYLQKKRISDTNYCNEIKPDFQRECGYQTTLQKYPIFLSNATKEVCNDYTGEIKSGCEDYFDFIKFSGKAIGGFFGTMMLLVLIPLVVILVIVVVIVVVIVIVATKKDKEEGKEKKKFKN